MNNDAKLLFVKSVHTLIWLFFVAVIAYVLYSGVTGHITFLVWIAIALVVLEGLVLLFNEWRCPLTLLGRRYTDDSADNFDIFLPVWLARNNKFIFTTIFAVGTILVLWRVIR